MGRNNEIDWLEQRFALMRIHVQEVKELQREQRKAIQTMKQHHHQQQMITTKDKAIGVGLITIQTSQLTELSIEFAQKISLVLARQRQEELALQERIDREKEL
jgi:S-adenosylmethionine synthetase